MILSGDHHCSTMLVPTSWGSTRRFGFFTLDGTPRQLYGTRPDTAFRLGGGIGDSRKWLSVVGILNVNDVSRLGNYSASFIVSRSLGKTGSISAGGLPLFRNEQISDGVQSYYLAYSNQLHKFSYTVGAGTGRFYYRSPNDMKEGNGTYGKGIFGSVSYDVTKRWATSAEWNGMNLAFTTSYRLHGYWPALFAGITDVTRCSGNQPRFVFGIGKAFGW